MKRMFILIVITIPLLSFYLVPLVYVRSDIKIDSLLVLPPVTKISVISKGSKSQIDEELSKKTFDNTANYLQNGFPNSVKTKYFSADSRTRAKLDNFVSIITSQINSEKQARKYQLPDSILNLFDTAKVNFVFCTSNIGFNRTRKNLVNNYQASEILNFFIVPVGRPLESSASMTCMILDLRQKNILYFERVIWNDKDPADIKVIKLQLTKMINHCFM